MTGTVRQAHRSRVTGTVVEVWDLDAPDAEIMRDRQPTAWDDDGNVTAWDEGDRWATFCVDHGEFVTHRTLALARWHAPQPQHWCEQCEQESGAWDDE